MEPGPRIEPGGPRHPPVRRPGFPVPDLWRPRTQPSGRRQPRGRRRPRCRNCGTIGCTAVVFPRNKPAPRHPLPAPRQLQPPRDLRSRELRRRFASSTRRRQSIPRSTRSNRMPHAAASRTVVPPSTMDGYWLTPFGVPGNGSGNTTYIIGHSWEDRDAPFNHLSSRAKEGDEFSVVTRNRHHPLPRGHCHHLSQGRPQRQPHLGNGAQPCCAHQLLHRRSLGKERGGLGVARRRIASD